MDFPQRFDVIVVGGGHAGTEAALAAARSGARTLLLTHAIETLGQMSCNPSIGGIGKGHLVKEVDALGGAMAIATDEAGIQFRTLNASKGPAVRATRAQADRVLYRAAIRQRLESQPNLWLFQSAVDDLVVEGERVTGAVTASGVRFRSATVVLTTGTFLGRPGTLVKLVEVYAKEQGLFHGMGAQDAAYSETLSLDLGTVEPSLAGPKRPQDRVPLKDVKRSFAAELPGMLAAASGGRKPPVDSPAAKPAVGAHKQAADAPRSPAPGIDTSVVIELDGKKHALHNGSVVIAAITSCTNTSNPSVMLAAGLVARKAVEKGLQSRPWVKTSLAPGSKVVTEYLIEAGLMRFLEQLRFHLVGYGCTTCIGNSGPLPESVAEAVKSANLVVAAVLSGNRNFEGRVHPQVRANYLASPPLVVAYALAGRVDIDLQNEPLGHNSQGHPVYLRDVWPTHQEISDAVANSVRSEMFHKSYGEVFTGDETWRNLPVPEGDLFRWEPASTYVRHPPYFENMASKPGKITDITGARVLALLGDSITTDHISPAGDIDKQGPAAIYLTDHGVTPRDFNSFGARRGNHEVMVRGTFANIRLKNLLVPGVEGGMTRHLPDGKQMTIFEAAALYEKEGVPLVVLAGKEYGSGSSRDWAAKGPRLLGVKFVIAESYERIHRSNLVGMGVLPLQFANGQSAASLGLTGEEEFATDGLATALASGSRDVTVHARKDGTASTFSAKVRIDTPQEVLYYQHGGILHYVLRQLLGQKMG